LLFFLRKKKDALGMKWFKKATNVSGQAQYRAMDEISIKHFLLLVYV
jgi:hypothetical protein